MIKQHHFEDATNLVAAPMDEAPTQETCPPLCPCIDVGREILMKIGDIDDMLSILARQKKRDVDSGVKGKSDQRLKGE